MYTEWIASDDVASRLNPEFYRPKYVENERRLQRVAKCTTLEELCDPKSPITNGIRGPDLANTDFRMLRLQDVDGLWMDSSKSLRVSESQFRANRRAECRRGDVLLAIGGYIGVVGKVVDSSPQTMGQHSARLRFDTSKVDPDFMLVFLSSTSGEMLCQRYVTGGVQQGINLEDVRDIKVPVVDMAVQHAIGDKLRKAERLRKLARGFSRASADLMGRVLGNLRLDQETRIRQRLGWYVKASEIGVRIDSEYYLPEYLDLLKHLEDQTGTVPLGQIELDGAYGVLPSSDEYAEDGIPLVRGMDLNGGVLARVPSTAPLVPTKYLARRRARIQPRQVLLLVKGATIAAPQSVSVSSDSWEREAIVNGSVYKFSVREPNDPYYVCAFLSSPFGLKQKLRAIANTGISYNDQDAIRNIRVALPDPSTQNSIGDMIRKSSENQTQAESLMASANADVDALIDGKLDESRLLQESRGIARWLEQHSHPKSDKGDT